MFEHYWQLGNWFAHKPTLWLA